MSKPLRILISGGGIAAASLSFWTLKAFPQASITVVERAPALRLTGASVDIRSSAVDIIEWMGLTAEIRKASTNESGMEFVRAKDGRRIGTLLASGRTDVQSITSEFEIYRGALSSILFQPTKDQIRFIFDETVAHFQELADGVSVTLANSQQSETYDLLVVADGLGSKLRGQMLNTKPREQIHDEGVHVAYFTIDKDLLQGSKLAKWYNATDGRVTLLRPDPDPRGRTRANLMNVTTKSDHEMKARLEQALKEGNEAYMRLMEELFADSGYLSNEVLTGMREDESEFYCSLFGQVRSPSLQKRRVVLLGDAGYATPGFGTSLAIIGGYVLAGELMNSLNTPKGSQSTPPATATVHNEDTGYSEDSSVQAALRRYEAIMQPFVKKNQGGDNAMQYLNPQSQWGINIRNALLMTVTGLRLDRLAMNAAALVGWTETKVAMGNYAWPDVATGEK